MTVIERDPPTTTDHLENSISEAKGKIQLTLAKAMKAATLQAIEAVNFDALAWDAIDNVEDITDASQLVEAANELLNSHEWQFSL